MAPGFFYKWEDHNHGLEHKCGTCATVLSSPRAKKTCFGIHEEVCTRYHKTLFYIGSSHHCDACHKSLELHDKRHREIAKIVQSIHRLDGIARIASPLYNKKRKSNKKRNSWLLTPIDEDINEVSEANGREDVEWDNNSSSLNNDADEGEQRWAGAMENADVRRAAKAERKVAKNQVRFDVITKEDLQVIQEALHPPPKLPTEETDLILNGQGLADNSTIDENIIFNPHTFTWAKLRERIREKKIAKNNGIKQQAPNTPQRIEELLSPIFASLCISPDLSKASRCRKSLDAKLRVAILKDITAFENEQAETMQRMAGYWRYVNRRTYNSMVRNNELWDWATGEKLPEIAEAELEAIDGEDESGAGILDEKRREGPTPEEYDPDFELPRGLKPLTLAPPVGRLEDAIHVKNLSFNPGQSPGPTLAFNVPSPSPSDEDGEVAWDNLNNPIGYSTATHNPFPLPLPLPNGNASDRDFQGVKDTRLLGKAIRPASPPREDASPSPQPPLERRPLPLVTTPEPDRTMNRFDPLDHETPAPCEEDRKSKAKPATTTAFKLHPTPIVKTLAIHDDPAWTVQQHAKGNRPGTHRGWRTPVGGNYKQPRKTATGGKL